MTHTNPLRSRRARQALVIVAAFLATTAVVVTTTTSGEDVEARPASKITQDGTAPDQRTDPTPTGDSELISKLSHAWSESQALKAEQVRQFLEAAAAAEAARITAERAAAEASAAEASAEASRASMGSGWAALRRCESGGNYRAVSANGSYRGAYQFSRSTWNSVAKQSFHHLVGVDPAAAAPSDQDAMALALYRSSGAGPWPHCGKHI